MQCDPEGEPYIFPVCDLYGGFSCASDEGFVNCGPFCDETGGPTRRSHQEARRRVGPWLDALVMSCRLDTGGGMSGEGFFGGAGWKEYVLNTYPWWQRPSVETIPLQRRGTIKQRVRQTTASLAHGSTDQRVHIQFAPLAEGRAKRDGLAAVPERRHVVVIRAQF